MTMKKYLTGIAALAALVLFANAITINDADTTAGDPKNTEGAITWLTIDEAQKLNKENPRPFFIDVYTDWCGWCKRMDKDTFADSDVAEYVNENYYAIKLDAESSTKVKFNGKEMSQAQLAGYFRVRGYPTIVLVESSLDNVTPKPGYKKPTGFLDMLRTFKASNS